jgi:hypothetical protein
MKLHEVRRRAGIDAAGSWWLIAIPSEAKRTVPHASVEFYVL